MRARRTANRHAAEQHAAEPAGQGRQGDAGQTVEQRRAARDVGDPGGGADALHPEAKLLPRRRRGRRAPAAPAPSSPRWARWRAAAGGHGTGARRRPARGSRPRSRGPRACLQLDQRLTEGGIAAGRRAPARQGVEAQPPLAPRGLVEQLAQRGGAGDGVAGGYVLEAGGRAVDPDAEHTARGGAPPGRCARALPHDHDVVAFRRRAGARRRRRRARRRRRRRWSPRCACGPSSRHQRRPPAVAGGPGRRRRQPLRRRRGRRASRAARRRPAAGPATRRRRGRARRTRGARPRLDGRGWRGCAAGPQQQQRDDSTSRPSRARVSSPRRRVPMAAPNCAPGDAAGQQQQGEHDVHRARLAAPAAASR